MKTIKTIDCVMIYNLLKEAKLGKMESSAKFNVIKSMKQIKNIATEFESFRDDAAERLKGENHDEMQEKAVEWQKKGDKCDFSNEEKIEINEYFTKYSNELKQCIDEEVVKENEIDIRLIGEDDFAKLLEANDWTVEQSIRLEEVMC